jgi:hypothetical protein
MSKAEFLTKILQKGKTANKRCPFCKEDNSLSIRNTGKSTFYKFYHCLNKDCYARFKYRFRSSTSYQILETRYFYMKDLTVLAQIDCIYSPTCPMTSITIFSSNPSNKKITSQESLDFPISSEEFNQLDLARKINIAILLS